MHWERLQGGSSADKSEKVLETEAMWDQSRDHSAGHWFSCGCRVCACVCRPHVYRRAVCAQVDHVMCDCVRGHVIYMCMWGVCTCVCICVYICVQTAIRVCGM